MNRQFFVVRKVTRYLNVHVQFCDCHEHDDIYLVAQGQYSTLDLSAKSSLICIVHLCTTSFYTYPYESISIHTCTYLPISIRMYPINAHLSISHGNSYPAIQQPATSKQGPASNHWQDHTMPSSSRRPANTRRQSRKIERRREGVAPLL